MEKNGNRTGKEKPTTHNDTGRKSRPASKQHKQIAAYLRCGHRLGYPLQPLIPGYKSSARRLEPLPPRQAVESQINDGYFYGMKVKT